MKKVVIISKHGTCYLDYRIISQAVFLKNAGFDVKLVEVAEVKSNKNTLYQEYEIPVIELNIKLFASIKSKFKKEILRLLGFKKYLKYKIFKNLNNKIKELKLKFDFIITRDLLDEWVIKYKMENPAVTIIADLHEVYYYQAGYVNERLKNLQDKELKHASYIINVTPQIAQTYYKTFLDEGRTIIIPNAPSLSLIPSRKPIFTQNKKVKFLCHGSYIKYRDVKLLNFIKDFIKYSPNHFVLYLRFGNQGIEEVGELKSYCTQTDAKERIFFLDPVAGIHTEIDSMIDNYDIGVSFLPTELGGQYTMASPNRLGTYVHAGLAILTNESLFMGEIVKEKNLGFVTQNDNFKEALEFIANNPEKVLEWRQNAYKFAKESFNYEFYGKELIKLLK